MSDRDMRKFFIFSSPVKANSVFETELEALYFILKAHKSIPHKRLAVFVYSSSVAQQFNACKRNYNGSMAKWAHEKKVVFINTHLNGIADHLASKGRKKNSIFVAWVK
ncbi:hypothetical protein DCAR_0623143 [Daucus carota subsp. sativus]|uniref:RNase H type-1 domain-containing protein n=1 Tax=Daucus carota subsp. sativus TaxID=79200 RepID=A0A164V311_DAUCS|nr:hypothetical protein DCAR_0623143 [Daucus carota subsp. sativus]